jgi:hypothetical protein
MKLINVEPTPANSEKKYIATLCRCSGASKCDPKSRTKIAFGSKGSTTFIDGATELERTNYIKRHSVRENWTGVNPGSLSRYILWSHRTLEKGIQEFKKRFNCN